MLKPVSHNHTESFLHILELLSDDFRATSFFDHTSYEASSQSIYEIVLYFSMAILGVLGNVATCVVIIGNKSMRTVTNAYLFNLAISDLLLLFFGFPTLNRYVRYRYDLLCKFRSLMFEGAVYVSVLTISAFSVERYMAICHPFRTLASSEMSRASKIIPAIWLLSFLCALLMSLQIGLLPKNLFADDTFCSVVSELAPRVLEVSTLMFFVLPMALISFMYIRIWINLKNSGPVEENAQVNVRASGNRKVNSMLVMVVMVFFLCWAPFHVQRLLSIHLYFFVSTSEVIAMQRKFSRVTGVFYYSSAVINPLIYNVMSNKFRQTFKETLFRRFKILRCGYCTSTSDRQSEVMKV